MDSRSTPDSILTEFGQQIEIADARCGSLKSQLDYMKMLYLGVPPDADYAQTSLNASREQDAVSLAKSSSRSVVACPLDVVDVVDDEDDDDDDDNSKYRRYLKEIHKIQQLTKEDSESEKHDSIVSPKRDEAPAAVKGETDRDAERGRNHSAGEEDLQTRVKSTENLSVRREAGRSCAKATPRERYEVCREYSAEESIRRLHKTTSAILKRNAASLEGSVDRANREERDCPANRVAAPSTRSGKRQELVVDIGASAGGARIGKRRSASRTERRQRPTSSLAARGNSSACKVDEVAGLSKIRRRRAKVASSNSRSTVSTRDTNATVRRVPRRRKQRAYNNAASSRRDEQSSTQQQPQKQQQGWNEAVEIYHNNAAKSASTVSADSGKHSKPRPKARHCRDVARLERDTLEAESPGRRKIVPNEDVRKESRPASSFEPRNRQKPRERTEPEGARGNVESKEEKPQQGIDGKGATDDRESRDRQDTAFGPNYYEQMFLHSYEMPTLASRLKRANRSYFNRFNFRNIPFIVGTSVSPSHNLGLNIQQVLSIMKTRQPALNGATPLLIRKVSRGMKPISLLMERMSTPCERESSFVDACDDRDAVDDRARRSDASRDRRECPQTSQRDRKGDACAFKGPALCEGTRSEARWNDRRDEPTDLSGPGQNRRTLRKFTSSQSFKRAPATSAATRKHEASGIGDTEQPNRTHSRDTKDMRQVLIQLHDQFEELNAKYERLQAESERSDDRSLLDQLSALETELNAKEEEINAVVGLYKEVMALKRQMKTLQEKNSLVCIATEVPATPRELASPEFLASSKCVATRPLQASNPRSATGSSSVRDPSTSVRLAGLLRQIQTFQKQLKLVS